MMHTLLGGWLVNPLLLAAGAVLVTAPIVIHLLNKRKFRTVEWAAMDFLLEADQRNRRRIQLEELLLLALRCLAVLLTGLLVARPYWPVQTRRGWLQAARQERIILLDDSPSMAATAGGLSPFDLARQQVGDLVSALADRGSADSLTLVLTSRPSRPVFADMPVNEQTAADLVRDLGALQPSDLRARLDAACAEVRNQLGSRTDKINRTVYVMTDLRRSDWAAAVDGPASRDGVPVETAADTATHAADDAPLTKSGGSAPRDGGAAVIAAVAELAAAASGCFVVDVGGDETGNLSVIEVAPQGNSLLAGVTTRFNVTLHNRGVREVRDVRVKLTAGGALPLTATLESVPAGGTAAVPFSFTFAALDDSNRGGPPEAVEVRAELAAPAGRDDLLAADNIAFYAARVRPGIPTLIVDGDPSAEFGQAETFFLQRALAPPGRVVSGIEVDTVSDAEFESRSLTPYQVVYLCNVYHLSERRRASLEQWVSDGGGLVLWPGGQIDERYYNEHLFHGGGGLLPVPLTRVQGDETEQTWVTFSVEQPQHPGVRAFSGDAAPLVESAKVFQWWHVGEPAARNGLPTASVVLRLTDPDRSPALIDQPWGRGRVILLSVAADTDWSNWPEDASYVILLQELNRYLAQSAADRGNLWVGTPLQQPLDLTQLRSEALITRPTGETVTRQAVPETIRESGGDSTRWVIRYDETELRGFYRMQLTRSDGAAAPLLFAANLDPREGDLNRIDPDALQREWSGSSVRVVRGGALADLAVENAQTELWLWVLGLLLCVLFAEQGLAWQIGRHR